MNKQKPKIQIYRIISLFLFGFLLVSLITILPGLTTVEALENNPTLLAAANNIWSKASFPVERFQAYTSPFGYRRSSRGRWEFHNGLDIAAPKGSYIRNWWQGTVIKVGDGGACGTHIIVQSGSWRHSYCHMQGRVQKANGRLYMVDSAGGIKITKGQQIPAGARIGRIGMTGRTTGPHLHWVLRHGRNYVDPAQVLRAMFSKQSLKTSNSWGSQQSQIKIEESKLLNQ